MKMIKKFMRKNYHTNEMVICSVGKIDPAYFKRLVNQHFDVMPASILPCERKQFSGYIPQSKEVKKDTFQSHCIIGTEAYDFKHDLRLPMVLLSNVLGGNSMNSRLNMALRERNGIAYNVEANFTPYTDTGIFMVYFGTELNNLQKALQLVEREFAILRDKKMGILQLSKVKKQLIGQLAISNENREDLMLTLGRSYLYFDKVDTLSTVIEKVEKITAEDIFNVANEMLNKDRLSKLIFQ
jgi:predicted Zn-dependent peptidase